MISDFRLHRNRSSYICPCFLKALRAAMVNAIYYKFHVQNCKVFLFAESQTELPFRLTYHIASVNLEKHTSLY